MGIYRVDLHVHTIASMDGCSNLDALTRAAAAKGLHAIAITDHNLCTPCPVAMNGVLLIPGCEISTRIGHITGLFLDKPVDFAGLGHLPEPERAVEAIRSAGGLAMLAHPFQRPNASVQTFDQIPFDGIETANARADLKVTGANAHAECYAKSRNLPQIGGSDGHHASEVGYACTEVECDDCSLRDLRNAVALGKTKALLFKKTKHLEKARSQWAKAKRSRSIPTLCKGIAYWGYCAALDLLRR